MCVQVRLNGGDSVKRADRLEARDLMVVRLAGGVKSWMVEEDQREQEGVDVDQIREI